jgi:hypothetical protein
MAIIKSRRANAAVVDTKKSGTARNKSDNIAEKLGQINITAYSTLVT